VSVVFVNLYLNRNMLKLALSVILSCAALTAQSPLPFASNCGVSNGQQTDLTCYQHIASSINPSYAPSTTSCSGVTGVAIGSILSFFTHVWNPGGAIFGGCVCNTANPPVPDQHPTIFLIETAPDGSSCWPTLPSPSTLPGAFTGQGSVWLPNGTTHNPTNTWNNYTHLVQLHEFALGIPNDQSLLGSYIQAQALRYDICNGTYHVSDHRVVELRN
jgi:hypothetical protein